MQVDPDRGLLGEPAHDVQRALGDRLEPVEIPERIILPDMNVVSEVMRTAPAPMVLGWLNEQRSEGLFVPAFTIGEIARSRYLAVATRNVSGFEPCGIGITDPFSG